MRLNKNILITLLILSVFAVGTLTSINTVAADDLAPLTGDDDLAPLTDDDLAPLVEDDLVPLIKTAKETSKKDSDTPDLTDTNKEITDELESLIDLAKDNERNKDKDKDKGEEPTIADMTGTWRIGNWEYQISGLNFIMTDYWGGPYGDQSPYQQIKGKYKKDSPSEVSTNSYWFRSKNNDGTWGEWIDLTGAEPLGVAIWRDSKGGIVLGTEFGYAYRVSYSTTLHADLL